MIKKYIFFVIAAILFIVPAAIRGDNFDGGVLSLTYAKYIQNNPGGEDSPFCERQHHISIALNLFEAGRSFSAMGKFQEAMIKYKEALSHYANGDIYHEYAMSLYATGRVDDALQAFKIAGNLGYKIDEHTYYTIACAYGKLKKIQFTVEYLDIAIMNGFREVKKILEEPDLAYFRSRPEWQEWFEDKKAIFYPDKTDLKNWLVAEYSFAGNAVDNSGNGHRGTVSGAILTEDRFGMSDNAYYFDGEDDFIELGSLSNIKESNEMTICYWFCLKTLTGNAVCGYISDYMKKALRFGVDSEGHIFIDPGKHVGIKSDNMLFKLEQWYFYVMSIEGGGYAKVYVNGKLVFKTSDGVPDELEDPPCFSIGAGNEILIGRSRAHFFNGRIDDFQMYYRALLGEEIRELYYSTKHPDESP